MILFALRVFNCNILGSENATKKATQSQLGGLEVRAGISGQPGLGTSA